MSGIDAIFYFSALLMGLGAGILIENRRVRKNVHQIMNQSLNILMSDNDKRRDQLVKEFDNLLQMGEDYIRENKNSAEKVTAALKRMRNELKTRFPAQLPPEPDGKAPAS